MPNITKCFTQTGQLNKTMENHITKTIYFERNFLKLGYKFEVNIFLYIKRNQMKQTLLIGIIVLISFNKTY